MTALLRENWGDLLVLALVAAAAAAAVWNLRRRRAGQGGCGCGCDGCPSRGICHPVTFSREKK